MRVSEFTVLHYSPGQSLASRLMNIKITVLLLAFVCFVRSALGQGTMLIMFEGPPFLAPGTGVVATNYYEAGMSFRPVPGSFGFNRLGTPTDPRPPNNGTSFVQAALGESLTFSLTNGSSFNAVSVDLAGYSTVVPDATIQFVGYRADGSTVTTSVDRHGITFETYFFGKDFSDLIRVEIPTASATWSLDNLVVSVPEPNALTLCLIGIVCGVVKLRGLRRS